VLGLDHAMQILGTVLPQSAPEHIPDLGGWNYAALALFSITQGYLAAVAGAIAAARGKLNIWLVFLSVSSAHIAMDNLWYFLGRFWDVEKIVQYGSKAGISSSKVELVLNGIGPHVEKLLFLSKLTAGMTIPTLIAAGIEHIKWPRALLIMAVGESIRTGTLVILGYRLARSVEHLGFWTQVVALLGGTSVIGAAVYLVQDYMKTASSPSSSMEKRR
jgi:membrane protein DedA with SNARE-associated domain